MAIVPEPDDTFDHGLFVGSRTGTFDPRFLADQPIPDGFVTFQGVFTGPDPMADKVLQAGDRIRGVPVSGVVTCAEALNNRGEIAMLVQSEDVDTFEVRSFVVKATPR